MERIRAWINVIQIVVLGGIAVYLVWVYAVRRARLPAPETLTVAGLMVALLSYVPPIENGPAEPICLGVGAMMIGAGLIWSRRSRRAV